MMNLLHWIYQTVLSFHPFKQQNTQKEEQKKDKPVPKHPNIFQFHLHIYKDLQKQNKEEEEEEKEFQWLSQISLLPHEPHESLLLGFDSALQHSLCSSLEMYVFNKLLNAQTFDTTFTFLSEFLWSLSFESHREQDFAFCQHLLRFFLKHETTLLKACQKRGPCHTILFVRVYCYLLKKMHQVKRLSHFDCIFFQTHTQQTLEHLLHLPHTQPDEKYELVFWFLESFYWSNQASQTKSTLNTDLLCHACVIVAEWLYEQEHTFHKQSIRARLTLLRAISLVLTQHTESLSDTQLCDLLAISFHSLARVSFSVGSEELVLSLQNIEAALLLAGSTKDSIQALWVQVDPDVWWQTHLSELFHFYTFQGLDSIELSQCQSSLLRVYTHLETETKSTLWTPVVGLFLVRSIFLSFVLDVEHFKMFSQPSMEPYEPLCEQASLSEVCIRTVEKMMLSKTKPRKFKQRFFQSLFCMMYNKHNTWIECDVEHQKDTLQETLETKECTYFFLYDCALLLNQLFDQKNTQKVYHFLFFLNLLLVEGKIDDFGCYLDAEFDIPSIRKIYLFLRLTTEKIFNFAKTVCKEQDIYEQVGGVQSETVKEKEWEKKKAESLSLFMLSHHVLEHSTRVLQDLHEEQRSLSTSQSLLLLSESSSLVD